MPSLFFLRCIGISSTPFSQMAREDDAALTIGRIARGRAARQRAHHLGLLAQEFDKGVRKGSRTIPGIYQPRDLRVDAHADAIVYSKPSATALGPERTLAFHDMSAVKQIRESISITMHGEAKPYVFRAVSEQSANVIYNALAHLATSSVVQEETPGRSQSQEDEASGEERGEGIDAGDHNTAESNVEEPYESAQKDETPLVRPAAAAA
mmetsp:Transcript_1453/g.3602  ORF Transcript_1453/g.3602 Transcript_1453/m.3602 type:complete len:209 (-) Transcript_1453:308-934(-)